MAFLGNVIWFVFGGLIMGVAWCLGGIICYLSIIGIPWGKACLVIGQYTFWPFGKEAVSRKYLSGKDDIGTGFLDLIGNILWLVFIGVWLAMGHIVAGIFCFMTIIGIPFGIQHFKLVAISLMPIGMTVVDKR